MQKTAMKDAESVRIVCREDESLLVALYRTGNPLVFDGCRGGGCGVCKLRILDGDYTVFKKMSSAHVSEEERARGIVLACCVKAKGEVTVTTIN